MNKNKKIKTGESKGIIGKIDLVKGISESLQKDHAYRSNSITISQINRVIDSFLEEIEKSLIEGVKVSLKGYFTLRTIKTEARTGVNPATKQKITIPQGKRVSFKISSVLKDKINS